MGVISVTVMAFTLNVQFWKLLDINYVNMLKVLLQQLQGTFTMAFKRHLTAENFTNVDQHTC